MKAGFSSLSTPELVAEITTLAGHLNAANARFLALIAELDRRRGWAEWGVKSCAHWLNWKCGIGLGAAREKMRAARALEQLPQVAAAMAEGRLSYFKVREMTRVANISNESFLLNIALCGTASQVEDVVRARLPAEIGALFVKALQAAEDSLPIPKSVSAETSVDTVSTDDLQHCRKRRVEALDIALAVDSLMQMTQRAAGERPVPNPA